MAKALKKNASLRAKFVWVNWKAFRQLLQLKYKMHTRDIALIWKFHRCRGEFDGTVKRAWNALTNEFVVKVRVQ